MSADWEAVLDALEARLRAQEAALEGRGPWPGDVIAVPLPGLGEPLPERLRTRAVSLMARTRALEAAAGGELARRRAHRPHS